MKKNIVSSVNAVNATTTNNATMSTKKEEEIMKKATNNATNNAITLAGVQISLTAEQAATIAAMLLGGNKAESAAVPDTVNEKTKVAKAAKAAKPATTSEKGVKIKKSKAKVAETAESGKSGIKKAKETEATESKDATTTPHDFADFKVIESGNKLSFVTANGGFMYQRAPRQALNERLKAICADKGLVVAYNNDVHAWVVTNPRTGKAPGKSVMDGIAKTLSVPVNTKDIEAVYAEWDAVRAKRAAKNATK